MSIHIEKQIGSGGFGKVFYVKLKDSGAKFALKSIDKQSLLSYIELNSKDEKKTSENATTIDSFRYYKYFFKSLAIEKEIGLLGKDCRFLVNLMNVFQTEVCRNFSFVIK